ncbi:hypothetical protein FEM03_16240 [Phragmitibacter flavus]|uniref:Uncharacterized protein n=1 Tax=Phragmitibacter flavus TaxID=2576071 RepID=A0A5R8KCA7_9BACT|nr:hypothetical protein [Phragmitibacter flavus]TLD69867.1 hypothetical protein FEM03_16240 [Phragmitibacter flavus]
MIIWTGHGILIPIAAIFGFIAGFVLSGVTKDSLNLEWGSQWSLAAAVWGATMMVWIYAKSLGKTTEQTLLDPRTRQPVLLRKKHTFFFITGSGWMMLLGFLAIGGTVLAFIGPKAGANTDSSMVVDEPSMKAFKEADRLIVGASGGVAHGNTAKAKELAEQFSTLISAYREMGVEEGKKKPVVSLSKGQFLTYCLLTKEKCVFLVHVPELRKFSDDAKDFICQAAWRSAQELAHHLEVKPVTLGVGVRGALLYERAMSGKLAELGGDARAGLVEEVEGMDGRDLLAGFFEKAEEGGLQIETAEEDVSVPVAPVEISSGNSNSPPAVALAELPTPARDWKGADGRVLNAILTGFVNAEGSVGEFKRSDGQVFQVPVDRFDAATQEELKRLHRSIQ